MKVFYDFEFVEDGRTIEPLSLGMVNDRGETLYIIFDISDLDLLEKAQRHPFVSEHVLPKLIGGTSYAFVGQDGVRRLFGGPYIPHHQVGDIVKEFLLITCADESGDLELWGYYSDYDHVALAQLWGPMVNMPKDVPWYTRDLKQEIDRVGLREDELPQQHNEHHALADALWNQQVHHMVTEVDWAIRNLQR